MAKRKLHHLHKIKIHPNRWLIWAIAYALFVTIAMVGYLKVSDMILDSESNSVYEPSHSYNDARLGFALRYPANWSIEAEKSSVTFLPTEGSDDGVTVMQTVPSAESAIKRALKVAREEKIMIGTTVATKIINDLGNGHTETVVLATHGNKLYVMRGSSNLVEKLLLTFHF